MLDGVNHQHQMIEFHVGRDPSCTIPHVETVPGCGPREIDVDIDIDIRE
jgi:hypothetical protein